MNTPAGEPLFAPERWREVRELLARLEALDPAEREREFARVAAADAALARAARTLMDHAETSTEPLLDAALPYHRALRARLTQR